MCSLGGKRRAREKGDKHESVTTKAANNVRCQQNPRTSKRRQKILNLDNGGRRRQEEAKQKKGGYGVDEM